MPKVSFRMASASRESVFGVQTNTAREIHRSDHRGPVDHRAKRMLRTEGKDPRNSDWLGCWEPDVPATHATLIYLGMGSSRGLTRYLRIWSGSSGEPCQGLPADTADGYR